jgi:hypothetical protein
LSSLIGCDQIGTAKESKIKLTDWQTEGQPIIKKNRQLHNRGGGGRTVLMNNNITIIEEFVYFSYYFPNQFSLVSSLDSNKQFSRNWNFFIWFSITENVKLSIDRPCGGRVESILIRSVPLNWMLGYFLYLILKGHQQKPLDTA